MRSKFTGKSLVYYKTGHELGILCPFCDFRVIQDGDEHMRGKHPDFWKVICTYQEWRANGWPRL